MLSFEDIHKCSYNPRTMDEKTKGALKKSIETFNDISGIVWNKRTSELVGGNHRWDALVSQFGEGLKFQELEFEGAEDRSLIMDADDNFTGYILRVVDWDEAKEKAANIAANSQKLAGEFTADLDDILLNIEGSDFDSSLFTDLRLDEMQFNISDISTGSGNYMSGFEEEDWNTDINDVEKTESNLDGIITTIKVECSQEIRSEVFKIVSEAIESSGYNGKAAVK